MSAGLPALTTPVGGAEALLSSGGGWIMSSSSDTDLYNGLNAVVKKSYSVEDEGVKAVEVIGKKHDAKFYAQKLDCYYERLIVSKGL